MLAVLRPREGGGGLAAGWGMFGSALLQPARTICISERFFILQDVG